MKELVELDPATTERFEANGKIYVTDFKLSVARYEIQQRLLIETQMGTHYTELFEGIIQLRDSADLWIHREKSTYEFLAGFDNLLKSMSDIDSQIPFMIQLCTLYINEENEDRRFITPETMRAKYHDWKEAGIEMSFFLGLSRNVIAALQKGLE